MRRRDNVSQILTVSLRSVEWNREFVVRRQDTIFRLYGRFLEN